MNVLQVTGAYLPSTAYGGPIISAHQMFAALVRAGVRVVVLTTDADGRHRVPRSDRVIDGVTVHYHRATPLNRHGIAPGLWLEAIKAVRQYDVVHCHGVTSASTTVCSWAAKLAGRGLVISPHGAMMEWAWARKAARKRAYSLLDAVPFRGAVFQATSEMEGQDLRKLGYRVEVVPAGVECAKFEVPATLDLRAELSIPTDAAVVAWIGRFDPVKNLEVLADALAGSRNRHLVLGGDPGNAYGRFIRQRLADRGVRAHLVGYVSDERKVALLQQADVYVAPSHMESYGVSIVEALASGCPVVASTGTPWSELQECGAGEWVAPTASAFRDAIERVLTGARVTLRRAAKELAGKHSFDQRARALINVYRAVLVGSRS